jgi:O-antigen/teichoic acid export membrane protein
MLHGTGAGAVATFLGIASNLLLLPLYLHNWTVAVYGEWMALYSVVNYLGTLDFGVTTAAVNAATMAYARKDWPTFKRVQGTAWAASFGIAGIGALVVAAILFFFHVNQWLGLKAMGSRESRLVFGWLSLALLASIPGRQLASIYVSLGEFAKYQWLYNAGGVLSGIAIASALLLGGRPVSLAAVIAATTLVSIAATYGLIYRRDFRLVPRVRDAEWATARSLTAPTGQFGIQIIATALTLQGPVVILSRALGGPAVALFTTTRTVANVVRGVLTLLRAPLRPEFAAAAAQSKDSLRSLFRIAVALDTVVAVTLAAGLWSGGVWLIRFWSHGHIPPDPMLLRLLLAFSLLEGFLFMMASVGSATNRLRGFSLGQLLYALVSLILAAALVRRFGPSAIPIGAILPLLVFMLPAALRNACNEVTAPVRTLVVRMFLPFVAIAAFAAAFPAWIASLSPAPAWFDGIISSLATCTLTLFAVAALFLTREDRMAVRDRIYS